MSVTLARKLGSLNKGNVEHSGQDLRRVTFQWLQPQSGPNSSLEIVNRVAVSGCQKENVDLDYDSYLKTIGLFSREILKLFFN